MTLQTAGRLMALNDGSKRLMRYELWYQREQSRCSVR